MCPARIGSTLTDEIVELSVECIQALELKLMTILTITSYESKLEQILVGSKMYTKMNRCVNEIKLKIQLLWNFNGAPVLNISKQSGSLNTFIGMHLHQMKIMISLHILNIHERFRQMNIFIFPFLITLIKQSSVKLSWNLFVKYKIKVSNAKLGRGGEVFLVMFKICFYIEVMVCSSALDNFNW